jgi:hypothetical protein
MVKVHGKIGELHLRHFISLVTYPKEGDQRYLTKADGQEFCMKLTCHEEKVEG